MEDLFKPKFVNLPYKPEEVKPVSLEAINAYFDASPVRILYGGIRSNVLEKEETIVYEAAVNIGVDVDKEKLLHALAYDRMQYHEGFRAGQKAAQPKWISVENPPKEDGEYIVAAVTHTDEIIKTWDIFESNDGWCGDLGEFKKVLYYMPFESLPEPPEVET